MHSEAKKDLDNRRLIDIERNRAGARHETESGPVSWHLTVITSKAYASSRARLLKNTPLQECASSRMRLLKNAPLQELST